jgi:hypothetical protein
MNSENNWDEDINELEQYFGNISLPIEPIKLNQCCTIVNVSKFIEGHLNVVKMFNGWRIGLPYIQRLRELKQYFINKIIKI